MIDWRASAEMASIWAKKPEPALRQKACESFDTIRSRMDEIARSEGRQPHRLNPAAEVEHQPEPEGVYAFFVTDVTPRRVWWSSMGDPTDWEA